MSKIVITGGAGFIASHLTDFLVQAYPNSEFIIIDRMSYAARREYLSQALRRPNVRFIQTSITNRRAMERLLRGTDIVIHAAAESHVDNSYRDVRPFLRSNVDGTVSLLQASVTCGVGMFVHVSTDEVYGDCRDGDATEHSALNPTNPYSASKAAAEMFVKCYAQSYGLATRVTRANNIYGERQFPEKLIPKLIVDGLTGGTFQIHGKGTAMRPFLHVQDFCRAMMTVLEKGENGAVYNVPAMREFSVSEVVDLVCTALGRKREDFVTNGPDRPHNDSRYGVTGHQISALGWTPQRKLAEDLYGIVDWYRDNLHLFVREPASITRLHPRLVAPFTQLRRVASFAQQGT